MSLWSRIVNTFRGDRLSWEIDDELASHIEEAIQDGRDPAEIRRSFGPLLRHHEESRDFKIVPWLDSLRADVIFGWRQLTQKKATSAAAVLSLALGIGACTSAFRLIDALLFRPLPISEPHGLYVLSFDGVGIDGNPYTFDSCSYPMFRQWRAVSKDQADLIAISYAERVDLTYGSDQEMEKANRQYVSGSMFRLFGLRPVLGRLLTDADDSEPGAHPYAVISHDYWARRFGEDSSVIGRNLRIGNDLYQIVGVSAAPFTGTETGIMTDVFVPMMMMNTGTLDSSNSFWFRTFVRPKSGVEIEPLRAKLYGQYRAFEQERAKGFVNFPKQLLAGYPKEKMRIEPAPAGISRMQEQYGRSLQILGVLVSLVLLIACVNIANLMTAQAAARSREMALRVSLGAGGWRLAQLVLVESAMLASIASAIGALFAWWAAPFVVGMINPPDNPARLLLLADWRVFAFAIAVTLTVTLLFGTVPALRASRIKPFIALKGGEDPQFRTRLMHGLVAAQVAFCFLVLFVGGLFVSTFQRLSNLPTGFSAERLLALETVTKSPQAPVYWDQVAEHLRTVPGVERVSEAAWPLLSGTISNNFISINSAPPSDVLAFFLQVSPGWLQTMKIPLTSGRDFRESDLHPGVAIVNRAFAKQFFAGKDPLGQSFETKDSKGIRRRFQIVGVAGDAYYRHLREPMLPVAYVPFHSVNGQGAFQARGGGTFMVRTSVSNPLALASILRREITNARPEFRVSNVRTQIEINQSQTLRERMLAMLALFFAAVALFLAGVGLYGVLDYSVLQRRREIGIRMAVGAQALDVASRVTRDVLSMVLIGGIAGLALGLSSVRYIATLLYQVKPTDMVVLAIPSFLVLAAAFIAAAPAIIRAVRIDPVVMLRAE
jgi:predicted permease